MIFIYNKRQQKSVCTAALGPNVTRHIKSLIENCAHKQQEQHKMQSAANTYTIPANRQTLIYIYIYIQTEEQSRLCWENAGKYGCDSRKRINK